MKRFLFVLGITAVIFPLTVVLFAPLSCACEHPGGDRFTVWDPFRDREPEHAAADFLQALSKGRCIPNDSDLCAYALERPHPASWKLASGEYSDTGMILYYRVRQLDEPAGWYGLATITVRPGRAGWTIQNYSVVY